jgi:hypothetical protein
VRRVIVFAHLYKFFFFFFFTVFSYFLNQFALEAVQAGVLIIPSFYLCSWRDTVIGDHSKIDNLVQVGFFFLDW